MAASHIKFEHSPADSLEDSFTSTPGNYSSLFDADDGLAGALTPPFDDNSSMFDQSISESTAGTPGPDKKQTKKRKSWGQQLPEPKTNLPPRKRAKTEDEKEQRRVERVLRNRRAAQSSRERKRMEVEALEAEKETIERKYRDLEMRLEHSLAQNAALQQQIAQITGGNPSAFKTAASSPAAHVAEAYRQASPLTLSQELFSSGHPKSIPTITEAHASLQQSLQTVNPASLSPEATAEEPSNASSIDMTQHPAAMLCDLPCQSMEHKPWMVSSPEQSLTSLMTLFLSLISLTASSTILPQLMTIMNSLTTNCPISPTQSLLTTIMWLTTTPACLSTLMTSSTTRSTTPPTRSKRFSLRMNLLRRLLACSPQLARPLMDATMGAMRLSASEQQIHARDCLDGGVSAGVDDGSSTRNVSPGVSPPTMECLMTLLWATKVIDRQNRQDQLLSSSPSSSSERNSTKPGIGRARISELDELFRHRSVRVDGMSAGISFGGIGSGKSVDMEDGWRKAF